MWFFKPKKSKAVVAPQEKMTYAYKAFGEEELDSMMDHDLSALQFAPWRQQDKFFSISERSFGSEQSTYGIPPSGNTGMFNSLLVAGVRGTSTRSTTSNESMTNELNNLAAVGILGEEDSPKAGHARKIELYLGELEHALPQTQVFQARQRDGPMSHLVLLYEKMINSGVVDPEVQHEPTLRGWVNKSVAVALTLGSALGVVVVTRAYQIELPDMFMHGMLLLVVAFVVTIFIL